MTSVIVAMCFYPFPKRVVYFRRTRSVAPSAIATTAAPIAAPCQRLVCDPSQSGCDQNPRAPAAETGTSPACAILGRGDCGARMVAPFAVTETVSDRGPPLARSAASWASACCDCQSLTAFCSAAVSTRSSFESCSGESGPYSCRSTDGAPPVPTSPRRYGYTACSYRFLRARMSRPPPVRIAAPPTIHPHVGRPACTLVKKLGCDDGA